MKRIFIGVKIEPGEAFKHMISDLRSGLKDERIKWTDIDNFHVTLVFIGDTDDDKIKAISKMLSRVCEGFGVFDIGIMGAGVFRSIRDPRVLWTGIEPSEKLGSLHDSLISGLKLTGIATEERSYNPHITLGRIKSIGNLCAFGSLIGRYQNTLFQRQGVYEVTLYESILSQSGAVYNPLVTVSL